MFDALNRAERHAELAEGCRRPRGKAFSTEIRNHFMGMAEHYRTLVAEADESGSLPVESHPGEVDHTTAQVLRFSPRGA
jgi:hypothetical protein